MTDSLFHFPSSLRLGNSSDYSKVFANPVKSTDQFFTFLAIKNDMNHPRLGLAIAKKNIKKAVTRNLIKRTVRENFRLKQHNLIPIDVVVLARREAATASPALLRKSIDKHWLKLANRCVSYS